MGRFIETSRSLNQPMGVLLSLTLTDFFYLIFVFGGGQILLLLLDIEVIFNLLIIAILVGILVAFRYSRPHDQLSDHFMYHLEKLRGGVIYDPKINARKKI